MAGARRPRRTLPELEAGNAPLQLQGLPHAAEGNPQAMVGSMKNLDDVKRDMSELYELVKAGSCDLKVAAELANITGKYLKAAQLEFAKEVYLERRKSGLEQPLIGVAYGED